MPVDELPPYCRRGAEPPRYELFAQLRERWVQQEDGRNYAKLAKMLGVSPQNISQWATGTGKKYPPPWSVIFRLMHELNLVLVMSPTSGAALYIDPSRAIPAAEGAG